MFKSIASSRGNLGVALGKFPSPAPPIKRSPASTGGMRVRMGSPLGAEGPEAGRPGRRMGRL